MKIEKGMKCKQIKPIDLGHVMFNYPEREFEIVECNESVVTGRDGMLTFGIDRDNFEEYFEIINKQIINKQIINKQDYRVIINNPVVVVILSDGTKGVAKCMATDEFDSNKGFEIAYRKAQIKSLQKELKQLSK